MGLHKSGELSNSGIAANCEGLTVLHGAGWFIDVGHQQSVLQISRNRKHVTLIMSDYILISYTSKLRNSPSCI